MKLRIHEIELGVHDPGKSKDFYGLALGLDMSIDQDKLKVFRSGITGLDFNVSAHLPANVVMISFLSDDLQAVIDSLHDHAIPFNGPKKSHLGMTTIEFSDPDGHLVRVN